MSEDKQRVLKLLEEKGRTATFAEFKETFEKFKNHDEAVAALRRGVDKQSKTVDRGSYCESASHDYNDWWYKNDMLKKMDLENDRVFLNDFNTAAFSAPQKHTAGIDNTTIERLLDAIERLTERVDALEQANYRPAPPPGKYKL